MQGVIGELAHVLICYKMVSFKNCANLEHLFTLVVDCNDVCKTSSKKAKFGYIIYVLTTPKIHVGMHLISYYFKRVYHNYLKLHNINLKIVFTNLSNPCAL